MERTQLDIYIKFERKYKVAFFDQLYRNNSERKKFTKLYKKLEYYKFEETAEWLKEKFQYYGELNSENSGASQPQAQFVDCEIPTFHLEKEQQFRNPDEEFKAYNEDTNNKELPYILLLTAEAYRKHGKYQKAMEYFQKSEQLILDKNSIL